MTANNAEAKCGHTLGLRVIFDVSLKNRRTATVIDNHLLDVSCHGLSNYHERLIPFLSGDAEPVVYTGLTLTVHTEATL